MSLIQEALRRQAGKQPPLSSAAQTVPPPLPAPPPPAPPARPARRV